MSSPLLKLDEVEKERLRQASELAEEKESGWEAECQPGSFSCHELLDRTALLAELVERSLVFHPACVANPEWYRLAEQASAALHELYQRVGAEHLSADE
jgi:hypothetical protein